MTIRPANSIANALNQSFTVFAMKTIPEGDNCHLINDIILDGQKVLSQKDMDTSTKLLGETSSIVNSYVAIVNEESTKKLDLAGQVGCESTDTDSESTATVTDSLIFLEDSQHSGGDSCNTEMYTFRSESKMMNTKAMIVASIRLLVFKEGELLQLPICESCSRGQLDGGKLRVSD